MLSLSPVQKKALDVGMEVLARGGPSLMRIKPLRQAIHHGVESVILDGPNRAPFNSDHPPGVNDDITQIGLAILHTAERALTDARLSPATRRCLSRIVIQKLFVEGRDSATLDSFRAQYGANPPGFLLVSPGKACNLRCVGCYADSGQTAEKLDWDTLDRLVTEAKTLWGARFFAISGGEPLAYRSNGKRLLDVAEKHPDCFFLMFTNGTLIDDKVASRLAQLGNLWPAISLEGWRERTDARRGARVFDKVLEAMNRLREAGVLFGVSLTPTRDNAEEILSDEFVDFCYQQQGALFSFMFQYMPIGRSFTLDLMPTPQQRLWMWRRSWEIIHERHVFMADFWNHGTLSQGCIAAGRSSGGGYLCVDWNGAVSSCVFMPYSPVNINEIYGQGKTLSDAWADPFFADVRRWQHSYRAGNGNWLMPCPMRDHHADLSRLLAEHEPEPVDGNARAALLDEEYAHGLAEYDAAYQALSEPIWKEHYLRPGVPSDG